jgi:hypothetical protein
LPLKTNEKEVRAALTQLRQKLLDLTALNPLISFKHSGKSSRYLRIVDEVPDQLTEQLYQGKALKFTPVPEPGAKELEAWKAAAGSAGMDRPSAEAWAAQCGISVSLELPSAPAGAGLPQHQDLKVQTPLSQDPRGPPRRYHQAGPDHHPGDRQQLPAPGFRVPGMV